MLLPIATEPVNLQGENSMIHDVLNKRVAGVMCKCKSAYTQMHDLYCARTPTSTCGMIVQVYKTYDTLQHASGCELTREVEKVVHI